MSERASHATGGINFGPLDPEARARTLRLPLAGTIGRQGQASRPDPRDVAWLERELTDTKRRVTELEARLGSLLQRLEIQAP